MEPEQFIVPLVALIVVALTVYLALRNGKRYRLVATTETSYVSRLIGGLAEVKGKVVSRGEPLVSPFSQTRCVYFHFEVEEARQRAGSSSSSTHWVTVIEDEEYGTCGVDDGTGVIEVDLKNADLILDKDSRARSGLFSSAPAGTEEMLRERYGRSSKFLIFNKNMRYTETVLEEGDEIYVLGDVMVRGDGTWRITSHEHPLIVSDKEERKILGRYRWSSILCWILALVFAAAAVYFSLVEPLFA